MSSPMATLHESLGVSCIWRVYENGKLVLERKNLFTTYGLTALAGAFQPGSSGFVSPGFLVLENLIGSIQNVGGIGVAATSVSLDKIVDQAGDTQLVLGAGTANQETVSFSGRTGAGPYVYTISATTKTHAQNDPVVRMVRVSDGLAQIQSETQYDATNAPGQRPQATGGYSPGTAQWTMQFFLTGAQANFLFGNVGLADNITIGQGNLHNHVALGYNHPAGTDVEIDVTLTLTNN